MASFYYEPLFRTVFPNMAISPALDLMSSIYKQNLESIKRRNLKTLGEKKKPKNDFKRKKKPKRRPAGLRVGQIGHLISLASVV